MSAQSITKVSHPLLGNCNVNPGLEVVNNEFVTWEPLPTGRWPFEAFHYSVLFPWVLKGDSVRSDLPRAHRWLSASAKSRLLMAVDIALWEQEFVMDDAGARVEVSPDQAVDPTFYEDNKLWLDTQAIRDALTERYRELGGHILTWEGEPPVLRNEFLNLYQI